MRYETSIELPNSLAIAGVELAGAEEENVLDIQLVNIGEQRFAKGDAHIESEQAANESDEPSIAI